jgi:putative membrane protein
MKSKFLLALLVPVLYIAQGCDDAKKAKNYNQETTVDQNALNFIDNAIDGGRTEIKLSTIAQRMSQNQEVTGFAKMMIDDHSKAITELKKIRKKELVNPDDMISPAHRKMIDSISKFTGSQFDKAYMEQMVIDHEKTVTLFNDASRDRNGTVQSFARKMLPTIQTHLNSAKTIDAYLK